MRLFEIMSLDVRYTERDEAIFCTILNNITFPSLLNEVNRTPGLVSTWMGDCLQAGKTSRCVTSRLGQLSLPFFRGR